MIYNNSLIIIIIKNIIDLLTDRLKFNIIKTYDLIIRNKSKI